MSASRIKKPVNTIFLMQFLNLKGIATFKNHIVVKFIP